MLSSDRPVSYTHLVIKYIGLNTLQTGLGGFDAVRVDTKGQVFGLDAVSYTHLDVYKRQVIALGLRLVLNELQVGKYATASQQSQQKDQQMCIRDRLKFDSLNHRH